MEGKPREVVKGVVLDRRTLHILYICQFIAIDVLNSANVYAWVKLVVSVWALFDVDVVENDLRQCIKPADGDWIVASKELCRHLERTTVYVIWLVLNLNQGAVDVQECDSTSVGGTLSGVLYETVLDFVIFALVYERLITAEYVESVCIR